MTLQQMEYIVALDKYRHFVLAAEACGVTQPTLSAMVSKMEDELDVKIFDRTQHPLAPTAIGEKIIAQAQSALNEAKRISELVEDEAKLLHGNLKLGIIPTIALYLVPKFIGKFRNEYPAISFHISEMRTPIILEQLRKGNIDMAIVSTPLEQPDIYEVPIYYEPFIAYFTADNPEKDHPLQATNMPTKHLWVLQEGHCIRKQVFNFCSIKTANSVYEAGSIDTLVKIVDANGGYTVIPEMHKAFLTPEQLQNIRPIANPAPVREVSIIIRKDYIRERMVNAVAETIKQIVPADMIDEQRKKFAIKLR